jgi:hypothetical protein
MDHLLGDVNKHVRLVKSSRIGRGVATQRAMLFPLKAAVSASQIETLQFKATLYFDDNGVTQELTLPFESSRERRQSQAIHTNLRCL